MDCSRNQALVSWDISEGALSYTVTAQNAQGAVSSCESTELKCTLTNLTCGQSYSVQVVARDDICSSLPSPPKLFSSGRMTRKNTGLFGCHGVWGWLYKPNISSFFSVPCKPNINSTLLDCFTNSALLDWFHAEGALNYTSVARSLGGHVATCNSNITNCEIENLQCGQTYNVIVVASNENCNSPPSNRVQLASGKCLNIKAIYTHIYCPAYLAVIWKCM